MPFEATPPRSLDALGGLISPRDHLILEDTRARLRGQADDFAAAARALAEATEACIEGGRVFVLREAEGLVLGSLISGVGIIDSRGGVEIVRVCPQGSIFRLARLTS